MSLEDNKGAVNPERVFNFSPEEVKKMFKGNRKIDNYESIPIIRPVINTDKSPLKILDSYHNL